jgi:hypothetical protein
MISFEQEVKDFFRSNNLHFIDNSTAYKLLDFTVTNLICEDVNGVNTPKKLYLEVKEKRQQYNTDNWDMINVEDEPLTFIVDELSCRKILGYAPFSGLLIRNNLNGSYYWFSVLDLFLMPKKRANRQIQKNRDTHLKGKILLDLRSGKQFTSLTDVFGCIQESLRKRAHDYVELTACYGAYFGENIPIQGIIRNAGHWDTDVTETR